MAPSHRRVRSGSAGLLLLAAVCPPGLRAQHIDVASFERIVRAQVDSGFSGVVLVANGDTILLRRAYGRSSKIDGRFWIASITKSFTAAAILALQKDGRLSVHDSIARFLPGVPVDKRAITIHQLLTHTAGFKGATTGAGITSRDHAVRAILSLPLAYQPGTGYEYGNDDYALLAAIVEIVTHRTWTEFVRATIVEPASLKHTGFPGAETDWGHRGSNGMSSTADDMLRWSNVLASGHLGALSLVDIERPQILVRTDGSVGVSYGYGARVNSASGKTTEVDYSGSGDDGNSSIIRCLASGESVVVLSNAGFHGRGTWAGYVASLASPVNPP